jgi:hypothetical protein
MFKNSSLHFFVKYFQFSIKKKLFFFLLIIFDFIPILIGIVDSTNLSKLDSKIYLESIFYLNYLSPIFYLKSITECANEGGKNSCQVNNTNFILFSFIPILNFLLLILIYKSTNIKKENKINDTLFLIFNFLQTFFTNLFEIICTIFSIGGLYVISNKIIYYYSTFEFSSFEFSKILFFFLALFLLIVFLSINYLHLKTNNLLISLKTKLGTQRDIIFSNTYNKFILILKILIAFRENFSILKIQIMVTNFSFLIVLTFSVYVLVLIFKVLDGKVLYIINKEENNLRIGFVTLTILILIFKFLNMSGGYFNFFLIPIFFLNYFIVYSIDFLNKNLILKNDFFVILFIVDNLVLDKTKAKSIIEEYEFTKMIKQENNSFSLNKDGDINFCKQLIKNLENVNLRLELNIINFCYLILLTMDLTKFNKMMFILRKDMNSKSQKFLSDYQLNLSYLFSTIFYSDESVKFSKIYNLIEKYNYSNSLIKESLKNYNDIILNYKNSSATFFYNYINSIYKTRDDLKTNILLLFNEKKVYFDLYSFFTLSYTYENLFKEKISEVETIFDMEEARDRMNFQFLHEKILNLSFSLQTGDILIFNGSKNFSDLHESRFDLLFPQFIRKSQILDFKKLLKKKSTNNFDFLCILENDLHIITYRYIIYQNFINDKIFIFGIYKIKPEIILVTSTDSLLNNYEEIIQSISQDALTILGLDNSFLDYLILKKIDLKFNFVFKKTYFNSFIGKDTSIPIYKLNSQIFESKIFSTYNFKNIVKDCRVSLELIKEVESSNKNYKVYSMKSMSKPHTKGTLETEFDNYEQFLYDDNQANVNLNNFGLEQVMTRDFKELSLANQNTITTIAQSSTSKTSFFGFKFDNKKSKTFQKNNFWGKITILSIVYNLAVILFCIIFFVLGNNNNNNVKEFYSLIYSFHDLRYFFYHTHINLFLNILVYKKNSTDLSNYSEINFYDKFNNNENIKIDLQKYTIIEFHKKVDILKDKILDFQKNVDKSLSLFLNGLNENFQDSKLQFEIFEIRKSNYENFSLVKENFNFFDSLKLFLNWAYKSFKNEEYSTNIYFYSQFKDKFDYSNFYDTNLSDSQVSIYHIFINFVNFYKQIESIADQLDYNYMSFINNDFQLTSNMLKILMLFHVLSIFLSIYILRKFDHYLNRYNLIFLDLFNEKTILNLDKKIKILEKFNKLYSNAPSKCLKELESLSKQKLENNLQQNQNQRTTSSNIITKFNQVIGNHNDSRYKILTADKDIERELDKRLKTYTDYRKYSKIRIVKSQLIIPLVKVIIGIYLSYFVFALANLYIFTILYDRVKMMNSYSTDFMNNLNKVASNILLFQTLLSNNQTDSELNFLIKNNYNSGYVRESIKDSYQGLKKLKKYENLSNLKEVYDFQKNYTGCQNIYSDRDTIFNQIISESSNNWNYSHLIDSMSNVCQSYYFMNDGFSDILDTLHTELLYKNKLLLNKYEQTGQEYSKMKTTWDDSEFFDLEIIFLIILRPVSELFLENIIYTLVTNSIDYFSVYTLFFLVFNIFIDVLIFYLIEKLVLNNIQDVDEHISQFILWV